MLKNVRIERFVCLLLTLTIFSVCLPIVKAEGYLETVIANKILFCGEDGELIFGVPQDAKSNIYANIEASDLSGQNKEAKLWIAAYKDGMLKSYAEDKKEVGKISTYKISIPVEEEVDEIKAGFWGSNLEPYADLKKLTANRKGTCGELLNIKWKGNESTDVYGGALRLLPKIDIYNGYSTDDERISAIRELDGTVYSKNDSQQFTDRKLENFSGNTAGYSYKFTLADNGGNSIFNDESVTMLYKKSNDDAENAADPSKLYEFDMSKSGMVYITMSVSRNLRTSKNLKSEYIEALDNGWIHDYNPEKYGLYVLSTTAIGTMGIPNGGLSNAWEPRGQFTISTLMRMNM